MTKLALHNGCTDLVCIECQRIFPITKGLFTKHDPLREPMCAACLDLRGRYITQALYLERLGKENYPIYIGDV